MESETDANNDIAAKSMKYEITNIFQSSKDAKVLMFKI